jgi:NAD-dependent SIR2 family protein deacetylase
VKKADLVFVIGTSLVVWPFAFLAHGVPLDIPLILINNEDSLINRTNKVWMSGDIQ